MRKRLFVLYTAVATVSMVGCGDRTSSDPRPLYSKAPLERPGVRIVAEEATEVSRLGTPNLYPSIAADPVE